MTQIVNDHFPPLSAQALLENRDELRLLLKRLPDRVFATLAEAGSRASATLAEGGGIFFVGNGGSAAQAEHLAAELVGLFEFQRRPLRASALTLGSAVLTSLANDLPPDELFVRPVRALMRRGDVLVALSTSGRSQNILRALDTAGEIGCHRLSLTGPFTGGLDPRSDWVLSVPSRSTARVQEVHLLLGHSLCQIIESSTCAGSARRPPIRT